MSDQEPQLLSVMICTYRRPSVAATIASVLEQTLPDGWAMEIVVADNDAEPTGKAAVEGAVIPGGAPVRYVHAPKQNISIARNGCLDAARGQWGAFIDDDEIAEPGWLATLIAASAEADVVFGRTRAVMDPGAPAWLADGAFHCNEIAPGEPLHNGYTCNVLLNLDKVRALGLQFDKAFGLTGGEDTSFFYAFGQGGARFAYRPDAVVSEEIPLGRCSFKWLFRRRYRSGQTHWDIQVSNAQSKGKLAALAAAKVVFCAGGAALAGFQPRRRNKALLRGALHLGVLSRAFGGQRHLEYA